MYQVLTADNLTLIADAGSGLRVQVSEIGKTTLVEKTPYCLATLYRVKGGFIPEKVYVCRALARTSLEQLKKAADFFFLTLLDTDLYVKEVPPGSSLFGEEVARWHGDWHELLSTEASSVLSRTNTELV